MLEMIVDLEERARELAAALLDIQAEIEGVEPAPDGMAGRLQELLGSVCTALSRIDDLLSEGDSPLDKLEQRLGPTESLITADGFDSFVDDHYWLMGRMGMDRRIIEQATALLRDEGLLSKVDGLLAEDIKKAISKYKDEICALSESTDLAAAAIEGKHITTITDGALGVCIVIVDVTGAFTVPDPTAFTYIKAMKSTVIGTGKIAASIKGIRDFVKSVLPANQQDDQQEDVESFVQRILRNNPRPRILPDRRKNSGES